MFNFDNLKMPENGKALPGRELPVQVPESHFVNGNPLKPPFPKGMEQVVFGMGCFWGAEKTCWVMGGVYTTAAGYSGGHTPNPTYREVCSGLTAHNEVVLVVYDPVIMPCSQILRAFWETHDPTQGMRQGNDVGTQYRSGIYTYSETQKAAALVSRDIYNDALRSAGYEPVTTEILDAAEFYYAEDYHQQYLAKNPGGYCGLGGTGVSCPAS